MPNLRNYKKSFQSYNLSFSIYNSPGFTIIELLVAITILALIATIGLTTYSTAQITGRDARRKQDLNSLQTALQLYFQDQNPHAYPNANTNSTNATWSTLITGYINQMPVDPINNTTPNLIYTYNGNGSTYNLCSQLENSSAVIGNGVESCNNSCGGSSAQMCYHLANP